MAFNSKRDGAGAPGERIQVLVAHADIIVRAGLRTLLAGCGALNLAPADASPSSPHGADVIIFDYHGGLEYLRRDGASKVLVVTQQDSEWALHSALQRGVHGFLQLGTNTEQLLTAVRALSQGLPYVDQQLRGARSAGLARAHLTGRETDVLQQLSLGDCNKRIARTLGIGVGTVKTHIKGLCTKLGATTRTQVVVLAIQRGLVCQAATHSILKG